MEYLVYKVNRWDDSILQEMVAVFSDFDLAFSFINYQASMFESFAIVHKGKRISIDC